MGSLQEQFGTLPPAPDRRVEPRTTPASLSQVDLGNGRSGIVLNISEAGMAVAVAQVLAVGERLPGINFLLSGSSSGSMQSVEVSAEIVWLSESKKGAGMQFVGLSADARNRISSWIARERTAPEFEHLPKPIRRDRQPLPINSARSRATFSRDAISNEEAGARYAKMFPSENANSRITATLDEIKNEEEPEVKAAAATIQGANRDRREALIPDKPETEAADNKMEFSPSSPDGSSSNFDPPEKSAEKGFKLPFAIFGFVLVAISFILGLTAGYAPIEKRLRSIGRRTRPLITAPSAPPAVLGEEMPPAPASEIRNATPKETSSLDEEASYLENRPAPSHSRSSNSVAQPIPVPSLPSSSASSTRTRLKDHPQTNPKSTTTPAESSSVASSKNPVPSSKIESKDSKPKAESKNPEERSDSTTAPPSTSAAATSHETEAAPPAPASSSTPDVSREPSARSSTPPASPTPTPRPAPHIAPAAVNVLIPPAENGKLVRAILPRKSIADSPELGITSQLSVLISPDGRFTVGNHETARLQAGDVITYVVPHQPRPGDRYNLTETVKVRATIGRDGRVTDVKPINGPIFLLASVVSAVRQWRFHPTLLNGGPVQAQDDVTIEFRMQR